MKNNIFSFIIKTIGLSIIFGVIVAFSEMTAVNIGTKRMYAAQTVEEYRNKALKKLEKVYNYYNKTYYTAKEYQSLTKKYTKGVEAVKSSATKNEVNEAYNKYKIALQEIKPSVLIKYQAKLSKSLSKTFNSLKKNNEYSDRKSAELEKMILHQIIAIWFFMQMNHVLQYVIMVVIMKTY